MGRVEEEWKHQVRKEVEDEGWEVWSHGSGGDGDGGGELTVSEGEEAVICV